jgi:peptidoglycan/xylan/chitin deacetylase (PgdA/CDA1 family)
MASVLHRLGVWDGMLLARRSRLCPWRGLTVLLYHRVARREAIGELDPDLVDATPEEFDRQMAVLRRHFTPVRLGDVVAAARGGAPLPPNAVIVTFDDGYRDNHDEALPILRRHGMTAVFFVSTAHVAERRLYWWERIAILVRRTAKTAIALAYPSQLALDLSGPAARRAAIRKLTAIVKDHPRLDLDRFLVELGSACEVAWTAEEDRRLADAAVMTWDEVRALERAGMDVASHTANHRVLQTLAPGELDRELLGSRLELEAVLGHPVHAIAYPVGRPIALDEAIRGAIRRAGYTLGFTTTPGVNRLDGLDDLLDLKRTPIDAGTPEAMSRAILAAPAFVRYRPARARAAAARPAPR